MLNKEEINSIAKIKGLPPRFTELDYMQDIALLNIYKEFGNKLVFKGGTCLYKIYQLNRFSEDLDFTAGKGFRPKEFFERLPYFYKLLNINCNVKIKKFESALNVYVEINGSFYDGKKESQTLLILNISLRERVIDPAKRVVFIPQYKELRSFDVFAMSEKEIFAEKVRSIYERNKSRDVFDLYYLLKKQTEIDFELINKKLSRLKIKFEGKTFFEKIEEKKQSWNNELGALIFGELPNFSEVKNEIKKTFETKF